MKYTIHIIALAILLAVSCQRNELPEENSHKGTEKILTVGVVDESDTRV